MSFDKEAFEEQVINDMREHGGVISTGPMAGARLLVLNNKNLRLESGCPNCGRHELMRISRRSSQRMLHVFGIPAYRYRCRNCIWEGTRLSDEGLAVSPGVALAHFDER